MGLLDLFRPRFQLTIGDCARRSVASSDSFPATLSSRAPNGETAPQCRIRREDGAFFIARLQPEGAIFLDGVPLGDDRRLEPGRAYGLALRDHLLIVQAQRGPAQPDPSFLTEQWDVAPLDQPGLRETLLPGDLDPAELRRRFPDPRAFHAFPSSGPARFRLEDLLASLADGEAEAPAAKPPAPARPRGRDSDVASPEEGCACPTCWKRFAPGEALNIAAHDALTGDPELGPHAKLRFAAQRFNALGQALDPAGAVSVDLACPHCRGRLPPSFLSQDQLIFSLVGAPSSGKSYYLSVLLKLLPEELVRHFGASLRDGDPSGNARLNEMKNRLFSATTPDDAFISKTDFEGVMYDRLRRDGKLVSLPRPFVFHLQRLAPPQRRAALVFYDNAGEHFKPGVPLDDSPGALHVAASAALLFLFDPTTNRSFRHRLVRKRDPQLRTPATDEQDTILAEMGVRIKKMRAIESHERIDTPLAVLVGKFDLWRALLPPDAIAAPEDRALTDDEIEANSAATRALLMELCPTIVVNAESISSRVRFFPASPLGHSPRVIEDGPLAGKLAPLPRRLRPILATAPALWALRQAAPELLVEPDGAPTLA